MIPRARVYRWACQSCDWRSESFRLQADMTEGWHQKNRFFEHIAEIHDNSRITEAALHGFTPIGQIIRTGQIVRKAPY